MTAALDAAGTRYVAVREVIREDLGESLVGAVGDVMADVWQEAAQALTVLDAIVQLHYPCGEVDGRVVCNSCEELHHVRPGQAVRQSATWPCATFLILEKRGACARHT
jgi:hypothetical protein